ncbi:MAG TPA: ABC-type transport auxiliary lipoprotein family protein [Rhodoblastus sp.]|nr:ABC-type transport auxiliary lipoprotein family protein [Rhodoblastus sp.]
METTARYAIVGFFTLVSLLAGFFFVYWLHNSGGVGKQALYWIVFDRPVIGVRPGVSVVFNGLRVGEVRQVRLLAADPKQIQALVAVDAATPVRQDTQVLIDSQGLMGSPVVSLVGGTPGAEVSPGPGGEPPLLRAAPDAGLSLTEAAKDTLKKIDDLISGNADAIHGIVANIDTFSTALAHNSDKVDTIFAGLEKLTGGGPSAKSARSFDLAAPQVAPPAKPVRAQVAIPDPTGEIVFDSQKILASPQPGAREPIEGGQWSDTMLKLVQEKLLQALESGGFADISKALEGFEPDNQILIDVRAFELSLDPKPMAKVEIAAKILNKAGKLVASRKFAATAPASGAGPAEAVSAMSEAFGKVATDLTVWAREAV